MQWAFLGFALTLGALVVVEQLSSDKLLELS